MSITRLRDPLNVNTDLDSVDTNHSSKALSRQDNFSLISGSTPTLSHQPYTINKTKGIYYGQPSPMNESVMTDRSRNTVKVKKPKSIEPVTGMLPHHKAGRMKVGLRCRPPFEDEIEFAEKNQGQFMPILENKPKTTPDQLGQVSLTMISGKQREFLYDYVFGPTATQDEVYDKIGRPVVADVLNGFNGTIFAYGQTGTGKTYTMGILEFVDDEQAGIIPRAVSQIFEYVDSHSETEEIIVTLSFLQVYRETIQDLLAPANGSQVSDDNLLIREDPQRGFYVEGLQDFIVCNYHEAEALLNLGLENRAIAPTLMNSTSSRSHTMLTINIEQKGVSEKSKGNTKYARTVRSKLLMVDLAGSERVRRTVSQGARLSEAKSINTSLSALGNVIAALAEHNTSHIPYRDSKLTRLLQDSLGGTASTALIATVGPAAVNYGETLSTLLFATRCMAVKTTPIQHEEVDYADLCVRLQEKISSLESTMTEKLLAQQSKYDAHIKDLRNQLETRKEENNSVNSAVMQPSFDTNGFNTLINALSKDSKRKCWLLNGDKGAGENNDMITLLAYLYQIFKNLASDSATVLEKNLERAEQFRLLHLENLSVEAYKQSEREKEIKGMENNDPNGKEHLESHLLPMSHVEAMAKVQAIHISNNEAVAGLDTSITVANMSSKIKNNLNDYESIKELSEAISSMHSIIQQNVQSISTIMARKDEHYNEIKKDLTGQLVEGRKREEEVMNWSYILKYLLSTTSKLKKKLQRERQQHANLSNPAEIDKHRQNSPLNTVNKGSEALSPLDRVQIRMGHMKSAVEEDKRREGQQGKLGPRLASNQHAINVNQASVIDAIEDIDQLGPPEDDDEIDQLELEMAKDKYGNAHSSFAQEVASGLNVENKEASIAMEVVDVVSNITLEQLRQLSPGTRAQILDIRRDLGLDNFQTGSKEFGRGRVHGSHNPSSRSSTPQSVGLSNKFITPQQGGSNQVKKLVQKRASSAERNSTGNSSTGKAPGRQPHSNSTNDLRDVRIMKPSTLSPKKKANTVVLASSHLGIIIIIIVIIIIIIMITIIIIEKINGNKERRQKAYSFDFDDYSQLDFV